MPTKNRLFVPPPTDLFARPRDDRLVYGYYNYLRPGLIPRIKRQRFEVALDLAKPWFHDCSAIDFGCADGVFLPTLSGYFSTVVGFDSNRRRLKLADELCKHLNLPNVQAICTDGRPPIQFKSITEGEEFRIAFVLETLEHVGVQPNVYESKMDFLQSLFELLRDDGVIIVSVPKMVGMVFLLKYIVQTVTGIHRQSYTLSELLKSSFLKNTDDLEAGWNGRHKGFNHLKLESFLNRRFQIVKKKSTLITQFYILTRGNSARP